MLNKSNSKKKKKTKLFKEKIAAGVYKHSDAFYHSCWFCVKKKNGSLQLVHDLQPLNTVTISNSGIPPVPDQVIVSMARHLCYTILDLFVSYNHCMLDILSCNLTTIQSPVSCIRLTCSSLLDLLPPPSPLQQPLSAFFHLVGSTSVLVKVLSHSDDQICLSSSRYPLVDSLCVHQ